MFNNTTAPMPLDIPFNALGIHEHGYASTDDIPFSDEVRRLCEQNICRHYGRTWACPPAVGSIAHGMAVCRSYRTIMLFSGKYDLEDSFDWEGMQRAHTVFKKVCDALYDKLLERSVDFLLLSNESCNRCKVCTYPAEPCRHPEKLFPSIEGLGIVVSTLANTCRIKYINGANTVTYFGAVLYHPKAM